MKLNYFVGKAVTIFTGPINRNFKEENPSSFPKQPLWYFTGIVEEINSDGLWMIHPVTRLKSFWSLGQIIGIAEEEILDSEKDAEKIKELEETKNKAKEQFNTGSGPYVDPKAMSELAKQLKEKH